MTPVADATAIDEETHAAVVRQANWRKDGR